MDVLRTILSFRLPVWSFSDDTPLAIFIAERYGSLLQMFAGCSTSQRLVGKTRSETVPILMRAKHNAGKLSGDFHPFEHFSAAITSFQCKVYGKCTISRTHFGRFRCLFRDFQPESTDAEVCTIRLQVHIAQKSCISELLSCMQWNKKYLWTLTNISFITGVGQFNVVVGLYWLKGSIIVNLWVTTWLPMVQQFCNKHLSVRMVSIDW